MTTCSAARGGGGSGGKALLPPAPYGQFVMETIPSAGVGRVSRAWRQKYLCARAAKSCGRVGSGRVESQFDV